MKSRTFALLIFSSSLIAHLAAMDNERPHRRWKEQSAAAAAAEPSLEEQMHSFFSTCGSSMAIARIEHGHLIPDVSPDFCDDTDDIYDAPIVLGLVRPSVESGMVYVTPDLWAHSVILPGVSRDWIEHGLDSTKSKVCAVRIYSQRKKRVLQLLQELPMHEQQQRERFMPPIIPHYESRIAALAAAEGIELDDSGTLTSEQRHRLSTPVMTTYGTPLEVLEREDAHAKEQIAALQEESCTRWTADVWPTRPAEDSFTKIRAMHAHLMAIAHDQTKTLNDRLLILYQESAHWQAVRGQIETSAEIEALENELHTAFDSLQIDATALWTTLQIEAQEMIEALRLQTLQNDPRENLEREIYRYYQWMRTLKKILGEAKEMDSAQHQRTVIRQLEEAFARAGSPL